MKQNLSRWLRKGGHLSAVISGRRGGFTYVEVLLVLGIVAVLLSLTVVLARPLVTHSNLTGATEVLLADTAAAQLKSMRRDQETADRQAPYGVHFEANRYILLQSEAYDPADPVNVVVELEQGLRFSAIKLAGGTLRFARGSGEVIDYDPAQAAVVLTSDVSGQSVVLEWNRYGVMEVSQ